MSAFRFVRALARRTGGGERGLPGEDVAGQKEL
jgi:hypothetical protein